MPSGAAAAPYFPGRGKRSMGCYARTACLFCLTLRLSMNARAAEFSRSAMKIPSPSRRARSGYPPGGIGEKEAYGPNIVTLIAGCCLPN